MSNDAKGTTPAAPSDADTVPDDLPPVQVLEAAEREERKDTEALLASFDKPLAAQRSLEGRDFVEYYTTRKGQEPPRVSRPSPFDAPPRPLPDTTKRPRRGRSRRRPLALVGLSFVIVAGAGALAFVAAGPEAPTPRRDANPSVTSDLSSRATSLPPVASAAYATTPNAPPAHVTSPSIATTASPPDRASVSAPPANASPTNANASPTDASASPTNANASPTNASANEPPTHADKPSSSKPAGRSDFARSID